MDIAGSTSTEEVSSPVAVESLHRSILDFAVFPRGGQVLKENSKAFDGSVLTSTPYQGHTLLHNNLTTGTPSISIIGNLTLTTLIVWFYTVFNPLTGLVKNIVAKKDKGGDRSVLISSSPLAYGNCYYLSMAAGRNVTISMHSAIIPTKIVFQHTISATTDENVIIITPPHTLFCLYMFSRPNILTYIVLFYCTSFIFQT